MQKVMTMAFQSLRDFMDALQRNGQLLTLHDAVLPELDLRTYLRAAADLGNDSPWLPGIQSCGKRSWVPGQPRHPVGNG